MSPISVTILLAAVYADSGYGQIRTEIGGTLGWGQSTGLSIPARMLLAAFERPEPAPVPARQSVLHYWQPPEGAWITNTLVYRGSDTISKVFMTDGQKYFGIKFISSEAARPSPKNLETRRRALPAFSDKNDILVHSSTHLQTSWRGNTFSLSQPFKAPFQTGRGQVREVEMLTSELKSYRYAKTDQFEAVILPANLGSMLAVLPAPGKSVNDLARELAAAPDLAESALKWAIGDVTMPVFHFGFEAKFRQPLEEMGIRQIFTDLGPLIKIKDSHLTEVNQKTDIRVDQSGILANAETVSGAVYGGILSAQNPFHMELNRPFIFLIRDRNVGGLLFLGIVVDPTQN